MTSMARLRHSSEIKTSSTFKGSVRAVRAESNVVEWSDYARPDDGLLATLLVKLLDDASKSLDSDRDAAKSNIVRASALLRAERDRRDPSINRVSAADVRGGLAPWQISRVTHHIDASLVSPIRIGNLAEIARLSPSYFCRAFKKSFRMSPHAYILRRRIERAQELMLATDDQLCQIALACGLCDQAHLSRLFRRAIGVSPAVWRRQRHENHSTDSISRQSGSMMLTGAECQSIKIA
jgi:AraC-like DNA-binding protein